MASTLPQGYKNLPANCTEFSALKELLDNDLEHRSFILRKQEKVEARYTYAKKAAEVFAACLATTRAVNDAYTACILSSRALEDTLKNALKQYDNHHDILATISSTKGMLATWAETVALTEALLTHLDKSAPQVEGHMTLAAEEHAAHESAHIAASESMLPCTDMLRAMDRSITKKKRALFGLRRVPTDILPRIFIEAVDARQHEIITSLSSYKDPGYEYHDMNAIFKTLNLVPFTLSATCKRWRAICQSTPQLWRYARVPMIIFTAQGENIIGKTQFEQCVLLARTQPLDLTVYPLWHMTNRGGAMYPKLVLPAESQILRVNLVCHSNDAIPPGIPSPTEVCVVASANSHVARTQVLLFHQLLVNTKRLRCTGCTPQLDFTVGIQTLHIFQSKPGNLLPSRKFGMLLQSCPHLEELHLEDQAYQLITRRDAITHRHLHTLSLTGVVLPWVIEAFIAGFRFPRLSHLVLTDINGLNLASYRRSPHPTIDQLSLFTHIEVHAASEPSAVAHLRPLFEASTALHTLTLVGSAVEPMLRMLLLSAPKRVQKLSLGHSNANGTTLRDYLEAIERDGGGTSGMQVVWNDCPNFSGEYGGAFGELHLSWDIADERMGA
jgi:hypothetical protein